MTLEKSEKLKKYEIIKVPDIHLLRSLGIREGILFQLQSRQPLGGPTVIRVASRSIAIDGDVAREIIVREVG